MKRLNLFLAASFAGFCIAHPSAAQADLPAVEDVKAIAEEAYAYGLPLVMAYTASYEFWMDPGSSQYKSPIGELVHSRRVFTYEDTAVIVPNSDTPYSFVCLDLRAEPYVVTVPAVEKERYYSIQFVDWNTFNYGYIGSRATGSETGDYLVAGPDWKGEVPAGIKGVLRSSSQFTIAIFRTQLFGPDDMANVGRIQDGYQVKSLSAYLKQPAPPAAPAIDFPKSNEQLAKAHFFELLEFVMQFSPAGPEEADIRAKLARIGLGPGKKFDFKDLPPEHKAAALEGVKAGMSSVQARMGTIGKRINGWQVGSAFGDRAFYQGDWLLRAAAAQAGIFGNNAEEAVYPMTRWLPDGEIIDTSKHHYTLTFPAGHLPPAKAFWSVTMYDGKSQLLIKNPIDRYLINSPMLPGMKTNDDGSITVYIQKDSPGAEKEANWLPAPNGPIYMVMRLYWPKIEAPSILPPGEGTWAPPAVTKVK
ncbi:DUF1254 domain-containing protein [Phragmitibacter flavus]|uniref:DUF1254 domain-containing protein n=1 Tax=Phragmitibacter flavus TaxID=2576071 RepID=A0A5R8KCY1_9BACT|nr:DUF1254 domain-containing protein [Phragmitibacter flavus]TLD70158.1 DUF1254 domain-containing protein [Phragmitibacter flavus]